MLHLHLKHKQIDRIFLFITKAKLRPGQSWSCDSLGQDYNWRKINQLFSQNLKFRKIKGAFLTDSNSARIILGQKPPVFSYFAKVTNYFFCCYLVVIDSAPNSVLGKTH